MTVSLIYQRQYYNSHMRICIQDFGGGMKKRIGIVLGLFLSSLFHLFLLVNFVTFQH